MNASGQIFQSDDQFAATLDAMGATAPDVAPVFKVTLNFRKGPSFAGEAQAASVSAAVATVRKFAAECGYVGAERAPTVYAI